MKKLDPKIIRVGDRVKIINPVFVIRCGYPLGVEDMKKEVEELFGNLINELMYKVQVKDGKLTVFDPNFLNKSSGQKAKDYYQILNALAHIRLKARNYGGRERTLHTEVKEELRGLEAIVNEVKMTQTGTYYPSTGGYDYYGESGYEPAGLMDTKTHKILTIHTLGLQTKDWQVTQALKIETTNVEKIPSVMETPIEYEHRISQMEKENG